MWFKSFKVMRFILLSVCVCVCVTDDSKLKTVTPWGRVTFMQREKRSEDIQYEGEKECVEWKNEGRGEKWEGCHLHHLQVGWVYGGGGCAAGPPNGLWWERTGKESEEESWYFSTKLCRHTPSSDFWRFVSVFNLLIQLPTFFFPPSQLKRKMPCHLSILIWLVVSDSKPRQKQKPVCAHCSTLRCCVNRYSVSVSSDCWWRMHL